MDQHAKVRVLMHFRRDLILPMLLAALASAAWGAPDAPLPKAEDILDKFVEVTGGKAAYEKVHNEKSTGTIEFIGKGVKGAVTSWREDPNKSVTTVELQGVGTIQEGTDGQIAWESSSLQGPRIKQGAERAVSMREATLRAPLYWRKLYKHVETVGEEKIDGQACYKVLLTPEEGEPETEYYDKTTGLMVKMTMTVTRPEGDISTETVLSDYKDEGGLRQPHKVREIAMDQEFLMTVDHVEYNVEIPANQFDLPADVKALAPK